MKSQICLLSALAVACLSAGCVVAPYPPPGPVYPGEVVYTEPDIFVPEVVIVERGVVHDRAFYSRHPEVYRRDRRMYPARFHHAPPPPARRPQHGQPQHGPGHPDDRYYR